MRAALNNEWVQTKHCGPNAARHYVRLLAANNISYRVSLCRNKLQIEVRLLDLPRSKQVLDDSLPEAPLILDRSSHFPAAARCLTGIVLGALVGAAIVSSSESLQGTPLPALLALAGCVIGLALSGQKKT